MIDVKLIAAKKEYMMSRFSDFLFRNETAACSEAIQGMHHAGYWSAYFQKGLFVVDPETKPASIDFDAMIGSHTFRFTDPVTGKRYDVCVCPEGVK